MDTIAGIAKSPGPATSSLRTTFVRLGSPLFSLARPPPPLYLPGGVARPRPRVTSARFLQFSGSGLQPDIRGGAAEFGAMVKTRPPHKMNLSSRSHSIRPRQRPSLWILTCPFLVYGINSKVGEIRAIAEASSACCHGSFAAL
jgi:hypothetical protein